MTDERTLSGKFCVFKAQGEDKVWDKYNNKYCEVLGKRSKDKHYSEETNGTYWEVRFQDGEECYVSPDELILQ